MDPNAVLAALREAVQLLEDQCCPGHLEEAADEVAEKFKALDLWLTKGGFPPADWWN